jgi:aminoglycoside/choline kinase family phosphotransferase
MPQRLKLLTQWLEKVVEGSSSQITPASADASFRRYFRINSPVSMKCDYGDSLIVMDAPPDKENSEPFIVISQLLGKVGVNVPRVIEKDLSQGFLLLTDLGNKPYLDALNEETVESLYAEALDALLRMQRDVPCENKILPFYGRALLLREMELFREWYLQRHCNLLLTVQQQEQLDSVFNLLTESALMQPQVFVHRDYHSRNLMVTSDNNPGILDFQDAVIGPVTYDLVSLLRDCYIEWPREQVEQWALAYLHRAAEAGVFELITDCTDDVLLRWFDWMGLQRHLKVCGIFSRLYLRDGKSGYLKDIPLTLSYMRNVCERYDELASLHILLGTLDD